MRTFTLNRPAELCTKPARRGWIGTLANMFAVKRQRRNLARLDDHLLNDIGLSRHEAHTEAAKPAWDVPSHWHK